jgi:xanthine dehydrogenase accessory factor
MTAATTGPDLLAVEGRLRAAGRAYAAATVVWRRSPSSGQVGSKAIITAEGRVHGWIAGACAEPAVVSEARRALSEGTPRLVFLGPPEQLEAHRREGVVAVPIQCQSEGALEVYVEPWLPPPHVVAVGRSPAAEALARMAPALGWRATLVDAEAGADPEGHPGIESVVRSLDLAAAGVDERSVVVVATQGHYDEEALEQALATPAAYVGLVASRRRAESVRRYLRESGVGEERLERLHAPAGLDLGSVGPAEIAVAILAELVQLRRAGKLLPEPEPPAPPLHEATDPVCGMAVRVATARHLATHEGRTYYFCSASCRRRFEADPAAFVSRPAPEG